MPDPRRNRRRKARATARLAEWRSPEAGEYRALKAMLLERLRAALRPFAGQPLTPYTKARCKQALLDAIADLPLPRPSHVVTFLLPRELAPELEEGEGDLG